MNERSSTPPPRPRLQELLAIPERQRTDEQWDEINDLEITLASANRVEARAPDARRNTPAHTDQQKPGGEHGKRLFKKPRKHPPKEGKP